MPEIFDHAAEARRLDDAAWQKGGPDGDALIRTHEQRQDMILSAQVHATLALVEQQNIANLIALYQGDSDILSDEDFEYVKERVQKHVRKGLGL